MTGPNAAAWPQITFSRKARVAITVLLTAVAAIPRFHDLDHLSFYSDEALTAISARSVFQGEGAVMASGMPYRRALPFTWANAGAVSILGEDREASYRAVAAAVGTLTPAALFLTGTAFVSPPAALVASSMLALSEWHVAFSRFARMYSPFLFFFILAAFFFWRWGRDGGVVNLSLGLVFFVCTVAHHLLGLFAVQFALIPLFLQHQGRAPPALVVATALGAAGVVFMLDQAFIGTPYAEWSLPRGFELEGIAPGGATAAQEVAGGLISFRSLLGAAGALLGTWLGWVLHRAPGKEEPRSRLLPKTGLLGAGLLTGVFVGLGHLWGATLAATVLLLLSPIPIRRIPRRSWIPALLAVGVALAWAVYSVHTFGVSTGIRRLVFFPFPYVAFLWSQFPGLMVLFGCAVLWILLSPEKGKRIGETGAVLGAILPLAAIGAVGEWGGTRYVFHTYPYLLLASAAVLMHLAFRLATLLAPARRDAGTLLLGLVVVLAGVTGAHGVLPAVRAATLDHGQPTNQHTHIFPLRPDHRGPGEYVRRNLADGDVVIAEQAATQLLYAGRVDYWFRRAGDAHKFLYRGHDGAVRDIYANSVLLPTAERLEDVVRSTEGRAWMITSGETVWQRSWYLSQEQKAWLDFLEAHAEPRFLGEDKVSRVYCLNCAPAG